MMPQDLRPVSGYVHGLCYGDEAPSRYFKIVVYPSVESMRAAAKVYDRHRGLKPNPKEDAALYGDMLGCFQPVQSRAKYNRSTRKWEDTSSRFAGVMRLVKGNSTRTIVAHECVHAVLQIARMESWRTVDGDLSGRADYGDVATEEEENLAYLLSATIAVTDDLVSEMFEKRGWHREID